MTIIDALPMDQIARDTHPLNVMVLLDMLKDHHVDIKTETKLEAVTDAGVLVSHKNDLKDEILCHSVVLSVGFTLLSDLVRKFENLVPEVHIVGDCRWEKGNLWHAITDGFNAAIDL